MGKKIVWKIGNMNSIDEILGVDDCRKFASFRVTSLSRWMSEAYCWTVTFHHSWFLVSCLFSSNRENRSNRGYVEVSKDISQVDGVLIQVRNEWRSLSMGCNVEESRLTNRFIDLSNPLKRKRSARMYILVKAFYQKFDFFFDEERRGFWEIRLSEINRGCWIVVEENSNILPSICPFLEIFQLRSWSHRDFICSSWLEEFSYGKEKLARNDGKGILSRINRTHFQISSYDDTIFNIGSMRD